MRVYKYTFYAADIVRLELPVDARILHVDVQGDLGEFCLWALVNPDAGKRTREIRMTGTGHPITQTLDELRFINTLVLPEYGLVFHFFELLD